MYNEIVSVNVIIKERFSFQKMLEIHQEIKKLTGTVFLKHKLKVIDATSLTKLVSFLLTVEPHTTIKVFIEGSNQEEDLSRFAKLLENETVVTYKQPSTQFIESSDFFSL